MEFDVNFPMSPPKCTFQPSFFHPNVSLSGIVSSSLLSKDQSYHPTMMIKQILIHIQSLLNEPEVDSPIQHDAYRLFCTNRAAYEQQVRLSIKHAGN